MNANESKLDSTALKKSYEPTPREGKALGAFRARRKDSKPAPPLKVANERGAAKLAPDHPEPEIGQILLMEALGTVDPNFLDGLIGQLANVGTQGRTVDERGLNFMLAVVKGVEPKDQVEAMLAAQMAAVHLATMTFVRRLAHVGTILQQDIKPQKKVAPSRHGGPKLLDRGGQSHSRFP